MADIRLGTLICFWFILVKVESIDDCKCFVG